MPGQSTPGQHAANQVQSITAANSVNGESRTYNSLLQMTRQTVTGLQTGTHLDVQYNFPATGNNGQLQSQKDMMSPSGEQVSYTYDTLKRLASATDQNGTNWSQTFNYDGFGNLTTVGGAGGAPGMQIAVDPATNRIQVGVSYDANGNDLSNGGSYDIENRLLQATVVQTIKYAYAAGNKRIWRGVTGQLDEVAFWSVTGQKLATYNLVTQGQATQFVMAGQNVYFGGKLVAKGVSPNVTNLQPVASDRLGSIGKFYPYGQEINPTQGSSTEKFTGYFRDVETGLDYADQRYYESWRGRFATADPSVNSAGAGDPGSWNRYAFVQGDPINYTDRRGLRRDDDNDWDWGYGLIPSFSFGGGAHSIVLDWLNIAYATCDDDGAKGAAFVAVRICIQSEMLLLAAGIRPITQNERMDYETQILNVLASVTAAASSAAQNGMTYPKYLLTTSDSYTCFGKVVERDVSYQLYASDDSKLNSGVITEHLFATDFNAQVAPNSSGKPNGTFDDTISIQFGYSRRYDQSFTVRGADVGLAGFANIPVFVRGFGGDYGILSIYKTATFVDINGNRGNVIKCN